MYIGETVAAKPIPMPPTKRQTMNCIMSPATAQPTAETRNATDERISVFLLPNRSASQRPASGPNGQPRIALPITAPYQKGVKRELRLRGR